MTNKDKQLLLKNLCGRLSYGVICQGITYDLDEEGEKYVPVKVKNVLTGIHNYKLEFASVILDLLSNCKLETVRPYLRPMSSMTEEEKDVLFCHKFHWESVDWFNAHFFDYRGLIEKGLAIAVTEENNPYKNRL